MPKVGFKRADIIKVSNAFLMVKETLQDVFIGVILNL